MALDTTIRIGGTDYVTDKATALKLYDLLGNGVWVFNDYSKTEHLTPLVGYHLQMSPLDRDFEADVEEAKLLGDTYSEYRRNKSIAD